MSVTQQIKDRLDIVYYIQQFVPDLKKAGRYYKACCPFHSEKTPSFVVNPDTQSWRCFGACAEGGDIFTFAQKRHGWSFVEALNELGRIAGVEVEKKSPEQKARDEYHDKLRGMLETAADYYHKYLLSRAEDAGAVRAYVMQERGFTEASIREWQLGYAPDDWTRMRDALHELGYDDDDIIAAGLANRSDSGRVYDRFRNRLMIPIADRRGRVIGVGARAIAPDDKPKYLNSPQTPVFDKSRTLFGLDKARQAIRETDTAVIVEGYMDVIQAHQAGYANVVAQMGTAMTEHQLDLIAPRHAKTVILGLDADDAGQNATRRSLEVARKALAADYMGKMQVDIRVLQVDDAKDPDDVLRETPDKWPGYIAAAMPVADFVIKLETAHLAPDASLQARQAVAQDILPILTASENNLYTHDNVQRLARRLRISEVQLLEWAQELQRIEADRQRQRRQQAASAPPATAPHTDDEEPLPIAHFDEAEMMPPPDDDDPHAPPLDDDDDDFLAGVAPTPKRTLTARHSNRAAEAYCLRMLIRHPDTLALVNRKLRELADNNATMLAGPLGAFSTEDFTQGDYRAVLDTVHAALQQDEVDVIDYLRGELSEALWHELQALLIDEPDDIHRSLAHRYDGEFQQIWLDYDRTTRNGIDHTADVIQRALTVRQQRLEREQQEIRFLLDDAHTDRTAQKQVMQQVMPTIKALQRIQQALKQRA